MSTIVTRAGKGSPLTHVEVDANFTNLNTDKVEKTSADITGGTINGTTIGATTPSSIVGTTITGQTGVLRGTGQNFLVRSQEFENASWTKGTTTVTANTTTAPDGTTTADTLTATGSDSTAYQTYNSPTIGLTYTFSVYLRADTTTTISIAIYDSPSFAVNIISCTVTTSWQRFSVTRTVATGATQILLAIGSGGTFTTGESVYAWGAQLELGSTANTYIPTTTTAVYGTPTLSFSGVSTLGLESNGALFLQPAGTGAIQAQATTSTTAGGNVRGVNAVDWQTLRNSAGQVASATASVIGGGDRNTASGFNSAILGGFSNTSTNNYTFVGAGYANTASGALSAVGVGYANTAAGFLNFIGGGFTNSGTASAAVTTQSGTMNGTTAVTLSGSNANIKVGQLITGTSINTFPYTYVAAISGTSLTLSQAASGSSTSTLSFFTPHGVVVGGGNNQATGAYSAILGGGDAGTAANRNVASGDWSVVCGGNRNTASGLSSFVGGGGVFTTSGSLGSFPNTASGISSVVVGGLTNTASAQSAFVGGGYSNTANSIYGTVVGGTFGTTRSISGNNAIACCNAPYGGSAGIIQTATLLLGRQTTDATATALASDSSAAGTTNQVILPNNSAYLFKATVISGVTGGGNTSGWKLEGVIKRGANAASTTIVGSVTTTLLAQDAGASGWVIAATADTTNGGLRITFTGQASTTIRTVCKVETTEMTY